VIEHQDQAAAVVFAYDWPPGWAPMLNPRCCTCGAGVRRARLIEHQDQAHPGWLAAWNAALQAAGADNAGLGDPGPPAAGSGVPGA
jgi:hypothetical protein